MGPLVDTPIERELTTQEVAAILRRHPKTVGKLCKEGKIVARYEGRHRRITERHLKDYIASTYPQSA